MAPGFPDFAKRSGSTGRGRPGNARYPPSRDDVVDVGVGQACGPASPSRHIGSDRIGADRLGCSQATVARNGQPYAVPMVSARPCGYYDSLDFNAPMSDATADRIVKMLATGDPVEIVDIGCGWAELLLRLVAASPGASGHGVDHDAVLIERATRNAAARSLSDRVRFSADVADVQVANTVLCVGSTHVFGSPHDALAGLRDLVRPGGRLLLGTTVWERPPTPDLLATFGDLPVLSDLLADAVTEGLRPLDLMISSMQEWDHFEFGFLADWEQAVMSASDPTESNRARRAADEHRVGYFQRRGVMGFAFLTFGRPHDAPPVSGP